MFEKSSKAIALIFGVLAMVFLICMVVQAWTEPSQSPPGGNVPAPINVGPTDQWKEGRLGVGTDTQGIYWLTDVGDSLYFQNKQKQTKMVIGHDGKVGINTTSPTYRLSVEGENETAIYGHSSLAYGVYGRNDGPYGGTGVYGWSLNGYGVRGYSETYAGVYGEAGGGGFDFYGAGPRSRFTMVEAQGSYPFSLGGISTRGGVYGHDFTLGAGVSSIGVAGAAYPIGVTGTEKHRVGVHGVLVNPDTGKWIVGGGLGYQHDSPSGDYRRVAGIYGSYNEEGGGCPSGYRCYSGYFRVANVVIVEGARLGIGTFTPNHPLDVVGKIHATGDICTDAGGGVCLSTAGGGGINCSDCDGRFVNTTGDTMSGTLVISRGDDLPYLKVESTNSSYFPLLQLMNTGAGGGAWNIEVGREGASTLGFYRGGAGTQVVITSDGKVGIGDKSPGQKLDVAGYIQSEAWRPRETNDGRIIRVNGQIRYDADDSWYWYSIWDNHNEMTLHYRNGLWVRSNVDADDLKARDRVCIRGDCRTSWPSGGIGSCSDCDYLFATDSALSNHASNPNAHYPRQHTLTSNADHRVYVSGWTYVCGSWRDYTFYHGLGSVPSHVFVRFSPWSNGSGVFEPVPYMEVGGTFYGFYTRYITSSSIRIRTADKVGQYNGTWYTCGYYQVVAFK